MSNKYDSSEIREFISGHFLPDQFVFDAYLFRQNWFRTGGKSSVWGQINTVAEWLQLAPFLKTHSIPYRFLGGGSNVLISSQGFEGFLLKWLTTDFVFPDNFDVWSQNNLSCFDKQGQELLKKKLSDNITAAGEKCFYAAAGLPLSHFHSQNASRLVSGFEPFSAIPAQIGGALVCNLHGKDLTQITASTVEIGDFVTAVFYWCPESPDQIKMMTRDQCQLSYDTSIFQKNTDLVVVGALFNYKCGDAQTIRRKISEITKIKVARQDYGGHTAGCAFQNYTDVSGQYQSTGLLLDRLGFKNRKLGYALVSPRHANFVVNTHPACKNISVLLKERQSPEVQKVLLELSSVADQVKGLLSQIKEEVKLRSGIELKEEIHYIGEFNPE